MSYLGNIVVQFCLYAVCALSLNVLIGYCGLFSLCHAVLYGLGAYTAAIAITKFGVGFVPAWLLAVVVGGIASLLVSLPAARLKGDAFALCTLAFQVAIVDILNNLVDLTGGPYGVVGIPSPSAFGLGVVGASRFVVLAVIMCMVCVYAAWAIDRSAFGRSMIAIRNDELAATTLGKNVFSIRVVACAIAGGIVALGGAGYASYFGYIDPSSFLLGESFVMLTMVVMGGSGNIVGPLLGAAVMVVMPEMLRLLNIPSTVAPNIKQMAFGAILIVLMFVRPQGLWGRYVLK
jgi:ABC-type branched-subunit amino acid transport system permease subunit